MKGLDKASIDAITINKLEDGRQMFMPCYIGEDAEKPGRGTPADGLRSKATDPDPDMPGVEEFRYIAKCSGQLAGCEYLYRLGISEALAGDFSIGFDGLFPAECPYAEAGKAAGGKIWPALIIPSMSIGNVYSFTALNTRTGQAVRIGKLFPFNPSALYQHEPAVIALSEVDALAVMMESVPALGLGVLDNAGFLLAYMRKNAGKLPRRPLILALGTDKAGRERAEYIARQLEKLGIPSLTADKQIYQGRGTLAASRLTNRRGFAAMLKSMRKQAAALTETDSPDKGREKLNDATTTN